MRDLRGSEIAMIFQDPMTSLNPVLTIEEQIVETIRAHQQVSQGGRPGAGDRAARAWSASRAGRHGCATIPTSSAAACASG